MILYGDDGMKNNNAQIKGEGFQVLSLGWALLSLMNYYCFEFG
jgi:hypothetical protein